MGSVVMGAGSTSNACARAAHLFVTSCVSLPLRLLGKAVNQPSTVGAGVALGDQSPHLADGCGNELAADGDGGQQLRELAVGTRGAVRLLRQDPGAECVGLRVQELLGRHVPDMAPGRDALHAAWSARGTWGKPAVYMADR